MGNRNNIIIKQPSVGVEQTQPLYLYSHWHGSELRKVVANAIWKAPKQRLNQPDYFTRILFCEMVKGDIEGVTDYGISVNLTPDQDPNNSPITVGWDTVKPSGWFDTMYQCYVIYDGIKYEATDFAYKFNTEAKHGV